MLLNFGEIYHLEDELTKLLDQTNEEELIDELSNNYICELNEKYFLFIKTYFEVCYKFEIK